MRGNRVNRELVSVITPCYNGAEYIGETIESVLSQTYKDWEMIIEDAAESLPSDNKMTRPQQDRIIEVIRACFG